MTTLHEQTQEITDLIVRAGEKAKAETSHEPEPTVTGSVEWPIECTVGPGLEGAIACESAVGYVNGTKGWLIYRGYNIFDLAAHSTFEEVSYLLLHGSLPKADEIEAFKQKLASYRHIPNTMRQLANFPLEEFNTMAALRLGTLFLRRRVTHLDADVARGGVKEDLGTDEDAIAMETKPIGEKQAVYEFPKEQKKAADGLTEGADLESCYRLIGALASICGGIARIRADKLPIDPDPELGHAANLLYMITGKKPLPVEERIMDVALILHADHGMNASTFASMVVASTLSDIYFAVGSGIAALRGPLHGGANERVLAMLHEIGSPDHVEAWYKTARAEKKKIMGFGHRVYKAYDPRARVLGALDAYLLEKSGNKKMQNMFEMAKGLEKAVVSELGEKKGIFPNVDFYSGIVYSMMGIPVELFTPIFAVSRVSGWTARVMEYLEHNRIFRPRGVYTGKFDVPYVPIEKR